MKNSENIDVLLKSELNNLQIDPPSGAWEAISSSLPANVGVASSTAVAKTAFVSIKTVVTIVATVVTATLGTLWVVQTSDSKESNKTPQTKQLEEVTSIIITPEIENSKEENEIVVKKTIDNPNIKKSEESAANTNQKPSLVNEPQLLSEPKNNQGNSNAVVNESKKEVAPKESASRIITNESNTESNNNEESISHEPSTSKFINKTDFLKPNIPNVFTPNNDGYNDEFVITIEDEILYDLKIVDIKGNIIFESKDKNIHWKGEFQKNGNMCDPGIYIYAFRYQLKGMNEPKTIQGEILLKL